MKEETENLAYICPYEVCGGKSNIGTGFNEYFSFPPSVFFHQYFNTNLQTFNIILLLPEGEAGEDWKSSNTKIFFREKNVAYVVE